MWIGLSMLQSVKRDPHSVSLTAASVIHQEAAASPHSLETQVSVCTHSYTEMVAFTQDQIITRK